MAGEVVDERVEFKDRDKTEDPNIEDPNSGGTNFDGVVLRDSADSDVYADDEEYPEDEWYPNELAQMRNMIRHWRRTGHPEKAHQLQAIYQGKAQPIPHNLIAGNVRPTVSVEALSDLEPPPRAGEGSGKNEWVDFASRVTDLDTEVLSKMKRGDIIEMLEDRDIIDRADENES